MRLKGRIFCAFRTEERSRQKFRIITREYSEEEFLQDETS